jgi:hypothetical protein
MRYSGDLPLRSTWRFGVGHVRGDTPPILRLPLASVSPGAQRLLFQRKAVQRHFPISRAQPFRGLRHLSRCHNSLRVRYHSHQRVRYPLLPKRPRLKAHRTQHSGSCPQHYVLSLVESYSFHMKSHDDLVKNRGREADGVRRESTTWKLNDISSPDSTGCFVW